MKTSYCSFLFLLILAVSFATISAVDTISNENNETDTEDVDLTPSITPPDESDVTTTTTSSSPYEDFGLLDDDNNVLKVPTEAPTFKEGDAPSAAQPSEVIQPIFEAPIAPEPISGARGRDNYNYNDLVRNNKVKAFSVVVATTIIIVAAAL